MPFFTSISRFSVLPFLAVFAACGTTTQTIPKDWLSVPPATRIRSVVLAADGKVSPSSQPAELTLPKGTIRIAGNAITNGEKPLTEPFKRIDSFDVSPARGEVVFAAQRETGFDIGLVAVEGSDISWVPNDPADEVAVQWAPRGSKISYIVRSKFADIIRTLHVPTSFSFSVDFPFSRVHALGWDPQAERYAVAYSSPIASDAVDVLEYSGEKRRLTVAPAAKVDFDIQPFAADSIVLAPPDVTYNERLPLVVWQTGDVLAWSDARAELMRNARVALVLTSKPPDEALLERARQTPIIDASRVFAVNSTIAGVMGGAISITGADVPEGRYRRDGDTVVVPAAVVESFAARFIAGQLKRDVPPNGSSR